MLRTSIFPIVEETLNIVEGKEDSDNVVKLMHMKFNMHRMLVYQFMRVTQIDNDRSISVFGDS